MFRVWVVFQSNLSKFPKKKNNYFVQIVSVNLLASDDYIALRKIYFYFHF